ncbi:MAG: GntR family transcriptional regulator [Turicibacter sp.]
MNFTTIEFNNKEPIYLQIVELIKKAIASGELQPGDKLPSVRELSTAVGVNPNTLQRAYTELERLGVTYTKRGMGSFVSTAEGHVDQLKNEMIQEIVKKFLDDLKSAGVSPREAQKIIEEMVDHD